MVRWQRSFPELLQGVVCRFFQVGIGEGLPCTMEGIFIGAEFPTIAKSSASMCGAVPDHRLDTQVGKHHTSKVSIVVV